MKDIKILLMKMLQVFMDKGLTGNFFCEDHRILTVMEDSLPSGIAEKLYHDYEKGLTYKEFLELAVKYAESSNNYNELLNMVQEQEQNFKPY